MLKEEPAGRREHDQKRARLLAIIKEKSLLVSTDKPFRLAAGGTSTYYFEMKATSFDPEGSNLIGDLILEELASEDYDFVGGLVIGAIPIVSAVCLRSRDYRPLPGFIVRNEAKDRGTKQLIEGNLVSDSKVILLDDVTTTGFSVLKAVDAVRNLGCHVNKVVTVVDRLEGAKENLAEHGIELVALFSRDDFEI